MRYEPLSTQIVSRDFLAERRRALLASEMRCGKQQPVDSTVYTPSGPRKIGDLRPGDEVCHPFEGRVSRVLAVYPQGVQQAWRLTFSDGSSAECGAEHLWPAAYNGSKRDAWYPHTLASILQTNRPLKLPHHDAVDFVAPTPLPLPPYVVGVLIGDGSLCRDSTYISIGDRDSDILDRVRAALPQVNITTRKTEVNVTQACLHGFIEITRELGLRERSADKFIPAAYKHAPIADRIELLRGLMDTDGSCPKIGDTHIVQGVAITRQSVTPRFDTKSEQLARDVAWLVRSLGGHANMRRLERNGGEFTVFVRTDFNPFLTPFKRDRWVRVTPPALRKLVKVEPSRVVEQVCISVSAEDGLYLTDDFLPTHNTGSAIMAADACGAKRVLVVTTASGRGVWRQAWEDWSDGRREVKVAASSVNGGDKDWADVLPWKPHVLIASYAGTVDITREHARTFDLVILDESHNLKNPTAQRTKRLLGSFAQGGRTVLTSQALLHHTTRCWFLTGTPFAHDLSDIYTTLRVSEPYRLGPVPARNWPSVLTWEHFRHRFCVIKPKQLNPSGRWIEVVIGGRNEEELRARMEGFVLRYTQKDIGALPPVYEDFPIFLREKDRATLDADPDLRAMLESIKTGAQMSEEAIARVLRLTGMLKAPEVATAASDDLDNGLDRLVIAYWNRDVGNELERRLGRYGVARVDGSTSGARREAARVQFTSGHKRVFLAQIVAAGEAIDLSAGAELWFAQSSFTPKDMRQMASRIVNVSQKRRPIVKVCSVANSIDEAIHRKLTALCFSIDGALGERVTSCAG